MVAARSSTRDPIDPVVVRCPTLPPMTADSSVSTTTATAVIKAPQPIWSKLTGNLGQADPVDDVVLRPEHGAQDGRQ